MNQLAVKFQRLANAGDLALPSYATSGAAGADLAAAIDQPICLKPTKNESMFLTTKEIPNQRGMDSETGF